MNFLGGFKHERTRDPTSKRRQKESCTFHIQSVKNKVDPRTQGNIKDFILGIIVKGNSSKGYM